MWKGLGEQQFGIDLGTSNTLIFQTGKGIVLNEPSVIALRKNTKEIVAVGEEASAMIGRTSGELEVIYPLKDGVIANLDMVSVMLQHYFQKIQNRRWAFFRRSNVVINVPCNITDVNRRAVEKIVITKGVQQAVTVEGPLLAAIGAGLPFNQPLASMIIDIGGGTTQVAILSLGGIVVSRTIPRGGMSIDDSVIEYIKRTYNVAIGEKTAENVKKMTGVIEVRGRDLVHGIPKSITVTEQEIYNLINDFNIAIIDSIRQVIEECPPELAGDVMERGIMLCGGGSLIRGIRQYIVNETKIPVYLAEQPIDCIVLGAGKYTHEWS